MALAATSSGQTFDVERPRTLIVGSPRTGARAERVDVGRTGCARTSLPASGIRAEWRIPLGTLVDHAPLVDVHGGSYVVGSRGEVIAVTRDGTERWRVATGAAQPGPPALLADDTLVFVDAIGQAIGVRSGVVRWRVRFGRGDTVHPAPLPLEDGGVVVATSHELSSLDVEGRERARTTLAEPMSVPLIAALGKVIAVTSSGAVWAWSPGASEAVRLGSFGSPVDGGAALAGDHTLIAVAAGQAHLAALDLGRGTLTTRAVATSGLWLGPPAILGETTYLQLLTPTAEFAIAIDGAGNELDRAVLAARPPTSAPDGGPGALSAGPHTPPLVDAAGTLAFATTAGAIGITTGGRTERLDQDICEQPVGTGARSAPAVVGLAPLEPGAFVAACRAGALLAIRSDGAKHPRD
jgi:hypothetical protein